MIIGTGEWRLTTSVHAAVQKIRGACGAGRRLQPPSQRPRAASRAALLLAVLAVLAGCTTVVGGSAVNVDGGVVDLNLLDVGDYPTTPRTLSATAGTTGAGVLIEAQRLANYVVGPWEVDPALYDRFAVGALVLTSSDPLTSIGLDDLATVSGRHNFINGFVSARQATGRTSLLNTVLRFADPPSAAAVLADLGRTTVNDPSSSAPVRRVGIPGHPDALATSFSTIDAGTKRTRTAVRSFASHGPYVLSQVAASVDGLTAAVDLVANTINLQSLVIDQFPATDPARFVDLAVDPTGLLARTLPVPAQEATAAQIGRFGKRGALHFQNNAIRSDALFDQTVMDLAAFAKTKVYRSSGAEAAVRIVDELSTEAHAADGRTVEGVKFLPSSRCVQRDDSFYCAAASGRFAFEVHSRNLQDAHQQVAAQYRLLVE